jgi:glycosyltransferase involved in cell wall biosynthesis
VKIVYSIDARLGYSGIGYTAYNAVTGIYQTGWLERLFVSSNAQTVIPASLMRQWGIIGRGLKYLGAKDRTGVIYYLDSILFDAWVAAQLPPSDIFHGWNGTCLQTLSKAKQHRSLTVVERASSHPATQFQLVREEYRRWNVPLHLPMWLYQRSASEIHAADFVTVPSAFVRNSMIAAGVPKRKLIEICFGIDLDRFSPADTVLAHPFRLIFVGQVSLRKGVPDLLESWRRLAWLDAELWIVGSVSPDFAAIRHRWTDVPGIRFIAHSTQVAQLFRQSDVFVYPSIEEGSALVTYEAMACGLPVITTPNAGSVVRDGEDGFIVPIRDVNALCDRLERLRSNASLRTQMGLSARMHVGQFTWTNYQTRLIASYRRLVG